MADESGKVKGRLQNQETFPYDCLDVIFAFTVGSDGESGAKSKAGPKQALTLGLTCKFWQERFLNGDAMWGIVLSQSALAHAARWSSHKWTKRAYVMAKELLPVGSDQLTPLEDCTLDFECPVYAEAMTYLGNKEFHCSGCNKSTFLVTSMEEKEARMAQGHCVMMTHGRGYMLADTDAQRLAASEAHQASPDTLQVIRVAVIAATKEKLHSDIRDLIRSLAQRADQHAAALVGGVGGAVTSGVPSAMRSVGMFPTFTVAYGRRHQWIKYHFKCMLQSEANEYDNLNCDPILKFSGAFVLGSDGGDSDSGDSEPAKKPTPFKESGPLHVVYGQERLPTATELWLGLEEKFNIARGARKIQPMRKGGMRRPPRDKPKTFEVVAKGTF